MRNILLLASKSASRQKLLHEAQIPFNVIEQSADETHCDWKLSLEKVVESIALYKMEHIVMPVGSEGDVRFVLTADTLSQDTDGTINGKPVDRADAIAMIQRARNGSRLCTAFCLDKKVYTNNVWHSEQRIVQVVGASYYFIIPDEWIAKYLENASISLSASNAITIEEYGAQFLKSVNGSYSTIVGLPMFELRQALHAIGFF